MKFDIVGLGNALLDFQAKVPFEFLDEIGVKKSSVTLVDTAFQVKTVKAIKDQYHEGLKSCSGGCAANTIAGISNFGGKTFFIGKVGQDEHGMHYRDDLEKIGVRAHLAFDASDETGTCLALITPDAERTMLTHLGVATQLTEKDLHLETIRDSNILYIEGYLWDSTVARKATLKAIEVAEAQGRKISFTYSDSFCVERHQKDFLELAKKRVQILFCNEHEAVKATGERSVRDAFRIMKDWCEILCVTMGPEGALLSDRKRGIQEEVGTWDVELVDKLGAGDLFAGGFLFGQISGKSLRESGYLGCWAATRVIQQMGARLEPGLNQNIQTALRGPMNSAA